MHSYLQLAKYLLIAFILSFITACGEDNEATLNPSINPTKNTSVSAPSQNREWDNFISHHTKGIISKSSPIRILFNQDVIDKSMVGKNANSILHISPVIKGTASYENPREIIFLPDTAFTSGQEYKISLQPNGLKGISTTAPPYSFNLKVIPLEYEIKILGLSNPAIDSSSMSLQGQVLVSDSVQAEHVKKIIKATLQNKSLKISWSHGKQNKKHHFTIDKIPRESFATDLKLTWDGSSIGVNTQGEKEVSIPAANEFKVLDTQIVKDNKNKPYIRITFSDDISTYQNLNGLFQIEAASTGDEYEDEQNAKKKYNISSERNHIKIYAPDGAVGEFTVTVHPGLNSNHGISLPKRSQHKVTFGKTKPAVRFVGNGSIMPDNTSKGTLEIPFEAVGVNAVDVTAFLINPNNIKQFLQVNSISGDSELGRVGRYLWRKTIPLNPAASNQWNRFSLDASELLKSHPGGLFRLSLNIKRQYSTYECPEGTNPPSTTTPAPLENNEDDDGTTSSGWDGIEQYAQEGEQDYEWKQRHNPCSPAYYSYQDDRTQDSHNFIASNIGLLAKQDGHNNLQIVTTHLINAEPLSGVDLTLLNYQGKELATSRSDENGFATIKLDSTPFLLIAKKDNSSTHKDSAYKDSAYKDTAYLKLNAKTSLSISHFDVGGENIKNGLKGYIYGERGVWRPGDDIFLTFVVQDKDKTLPTNHPVTLQLFNPDGQLSQTFTSKDSIGGFYAFKFTTDEADPTGKWLAKAHLGGSTFSKTLMIETVRPNRLKVELDFATEALHGYESLPTASLFGQWLHGTSASNLKADVSVRFREKTTKFTQFSDYSFDDPARKLDSEDQKLLEGRLDDSGNLTFNRNFKPSSTPSGMLSAWFTSRVFEQGGAFSISKQFMDYHFFRNYVGIKIPKGDAERNMLLTDQKHSINIASLNAEGNPISLDKVQVTLYKVDWKWWWDKSSDSLTEYADAKHKSKLQQSIVSTSNGSGTWDFEISYPEWGRYLIRACDLEGKHCTGKTVYIDWPGWAGRAQEQGSGAASKLNLFSDKKEYTVGEIATIQLPKASQGRALLTVETGSDILQQQWVEFNAERTQIELPVTEQMAPNAYINISLLQPHQNKGNDRPIRLYGIIPITVKDPATHLKPIVEAADEWKPQSKQLITVKEANAKPMSYTLAVVDEGLLGLTRFKTPDLHKQFYRREALGIQTWDLFDDVIGAYGTKLERLLALGGGDDIQLDDDANRTKRFPPVVKYLGPFQLQAGEIKQHEIILAPYIGAVRVMLIAGGSAAGGTSTGAAAAYGKAEKSIFVKQPLILQASLPRVLSTNEEVVIPVTLFSTEESIKEVNLTLVTDDKVTVPGEASHTVHFDKTGDKLAYVRIKTGAQSGKARLHFTASSGEHISESEVFIDVRQPNQETSRISTKVLEAGESWSNTLAAYGLPGTSHATLELSSIPPMNLEKHMDYLVRYPHGCLEQTTSSAFPQLYLPTLTTLDKEKSASIQHNVESAIEKIRKFQNADGDFSYWPNGNDINDWSSLYAGHFLIEAQNKGYLVPPGLLTQWLKQQSRSAQHWLAGSKDYSHIQAYRLYVLAQASKPEMGAMNRLRESGSLNNKAKWLLAAAYQHTGQAEAAKQLTQGLMPKVQEEKDYDNETFSTTLSDLGLQLETLNTLHKKQDAEHFVQLISNELAKDNHNTHGIAWSLMAVSRYLGGQATHFQAEYTLDKGSTNKISSNLHIANQPLGKFVESREISLKNTSKGKLFATLINKGIPKAADEQAVENGLKVQADYYYLKDKEAIAINDLSTIIAGKDIAVRINISNISGRNLKNISLSHLLPTGWEIHNPSYNLGKEQGNSNAKSDHQDVRDDRIYTYMEIENNQTKAFTVLINPVYKGNYYLPAITVESMYEPSIIGRTKGQWIEVIDQEETRNKPTEEALATVGIAPIKLGLATITAEKAWFYDRPEEESKTTIYVVKGDEVNIIKKQGDWLRVQFKSKQDYEKWIKSATILLRDQT